MGKAKGNFRRAAASYAEKTRRPLNCLLFILPLMTAYEAGALFFGHPLLAIRHLSGLLKFFGATGRFLPLVLIIVVLLAWHIIGRQKWHADGEALLGMVAEGILWTIPLLLLHALTWRLLSFPALSAGGDQASLAARILTGIGAGVYEEFLFRLAGIGLFLLLTVDVASGPRRPMIAAAVVLTSILFSLYHFVGAGTFPFDMYRFVFRALAGAYLAGLYITRGFGVAVGTHACYNVVVAVISE